MSSSLTKGLRRSTSRSKAKPAAKSAKRAAKAKSPSKPKARRAAAAKPSARTAVSLRAAKKTAAKPKPSVKAKKTAAKAATKPARKASAARRLRKFQGSKRRRSRRQFALSDQRPRQPPPPRPQTQDESAALVAFERAHKEFARGRFAEARNQFRILVDKYSQVAEVAARARTYLTIAEARLRTESILPRDCRLALRSRRYRIEPR
jgi:hypothetical protein